MQVVHTKAADFETAGKIEQVERETLTTEEMQYVWEQREDWIRLIQPTQHQSSDRVLNRVAEDEMKIGGEVIGRLAHQPSLVIYFIRGQCCISGGRHSKKSGSRLEHTVAVIYDAACINELRARGYAVDMIIDAWCDLEGAGNLML